MAMDPTVLSSNWKKLQATLPKKDPKDATSLKRKRTDATDQKPKKAQKSNSFTRKSKSKAQMNGTATTKPKNTIQKAKSAPSLRQAASKARDSSAESEEEQEDDDDASSEPDLPSSKTSTATLIANEGDKLNEGVSQTALAGKYIALDCEMVGYGPNPRDDSQVARVSLVNYHGEQIYDTFVLPQVPVTDYRTAITGITAPMLKSMGRPFKEVQKDVTAFLGGRVLVGHALKNDLDVLMVSHPRRDIRDTSRHANFRARSMGKTPALRNLARDVLGMEIQKGVHSSVEDARISMLLYKKEKDNFEAEHASKFGRRNGAMTGQEMKGKKKKKGKR